GKNRQGWKTRRRASAGETQVIFCERDDLTKLFSERFLWIRKNLFTDLSSFAKPPDSDSPRLSGLSVPGQFLPDHLPIIGWRHRRDFLPVYEVWSCLGSAQSKAFELTAKPKQSAPEWLDGHLR